MYSRFHTSSSLSPSSELVQVQQSFEPVIVDLDDGNQFLMSKCSKCGFVCRNNTNTKHAHWKRCPSKFMFKYLSQNESTIGCVVLCTMCNMKFMKPDMITMKTHSQKCMRVAHQPTDSVPYIFGNSRFGTNDASNTVEKIHENTVSRKEIEAQRKVLLTKKNKKVSIPGFRIKYIPNENGAERYSECQVCNTLFKKPTNFTLKAHRTMCSYPSISYPNGILMSVSTQSAASHPFQSTTFQSLNSHQQLPFHPMSSHQVPPYAMPSNTTPLHPMQSRQMTSHTMVSPSMVLQPIASPSIISRPMTAQSMDYQSSDSTITSSVGDNGISRFTVSQNISKTNSPNPVKMCFICNTTSSELFVSLYQTTSKHSNTRIYDFIWRFLNDQPSVRDPSADAANWSFICVECLDMVNEYDLAKSQAAKYERCLRDKLSQTETYYLKQRMPLESPTICAQREREQLQQRNNYGNEVDMTARDSGQRYADEPNDAVHYLVELSDEDENEKERQEEDEDEGKEEGVEEVHTIVLSDEED